MNYILFETWYHLALYGRVFNLASPTFTSRKHVKDSMQDVFGHVEQIVRQIPVAQHGLIYTIAPTAKRGR